MDFLRAHQLNIMLFMSGICGVLAVLVLLTESVSRRRKGILASIEASAMFLLLADRYAYIFRGDPSQLGYWMVRICNFLVFFLTLFISNGITLYMMDLYTNEGRMSKPPRPLQAGDRLRTGVASNFQNRAVPKAPKWSSWWKPASSTHLMPSARGRPPSSAWASLLWSRNPCISSARVPKR